ncbi:hypothetical protein EGH21_21165 [Halomicroarcula sp. F13]|uniref:Sodium:solute symporter family protein n=1 Tax=Haloarcula rubra TaxID=2487747 RepID=A0AAW4PY13_9EURY|nr:hypothetical protein [Halomicroarcula rubra]MBX0325539.1 hypothetical protein [Halomicroarcula rubra]
MGGTFAVPFLLGLHWKRATTQGGIVGMTVGFSTVVVWHAATNIYSFVPARADALVGDPVVPGVLASLLAFVAVSFVTSPPSLRSLSSFFDVGEDATDRR